MFYHYGIFSDPEFVRRNTILNFLHSSFPSQELQLDQIVTYSDQLRAYYHNLSLENEQQDRLNNLRLVYSTVHHHSDQLSELDWFYIERISIHFANFSRKVSERIVFLLNRN